MEGSDFFKRKTPEERVLEGENRNNEKNLNRKTNMMKIAYEVLIMHRKTNTSGLSVTISIRYTVNIPL